jgi:gliding motility-associated-like protein
VANDDYDTTAYRTEVIIPVLANDTDPQNILNPASLKITSAPVNGTAYVDFGNYTIHYRPNEGFSGNEIFGYEVCNTANLCDNAKVYVLVTEYLFRIPNAFTPNGDGINDFFEIIGIQLYPGNSITIVNRWGNKVYEAKNYGIDTSPVFWDGYANTGSTFLGNELPTGTYYYILDLGNGDKPIAGSIYLDR